MTDAKPQSTPTSWPISRRRLLALSAAVPAAIAAANSLPGRRIGASAPGATSALAAPAAPAVPTYWFC
jgi:hypothetical protein